MVQDLSRRSFLRSILLGAVAPAIIKPKSFFSFFGTGEVWKPKLASLPTLADYAKKLDPRHNAAKIAELLAQANTILDDIPWNEENGIWISKNRIR